MLVSKRKNLSHW